MKDVKLPPYIGENYNTYKILLVGESHYNSLPLTKDKKFIFRNWYTTSITLENNELFNQFNTIYQVNYYLNGGKGLYAIYRFPDKVLSRVFGIPEKKAFTYTSFYNYFQRPNMTKGTFTLCNEIRLPHKDYEYKFAIQAFYMLIFELKPNIIFFLSKKAFNHFKNDATSYIPAHLEYVSATVIDLVHPASAWWFKNNGSYGDKKMENALREFFHIKEEDFHVKTNGL